MSDDEPESDPPRGRRLGVLSLAAIGVVFGDIGTSPLYAVRECFHGDYAIAATGQNVLGVVSLIFWSVTLVVTIKYLVFVLKADNQGEGGVIALTALVDEQKGRRGRIFVLLGLFAAALLYGDGMITPSISVLSAVEGVAVAAPAFADWVLPATVAILVALFLFQHKGTKRVGSLFGPITSLWLLTIAALGVRGIVDRPDVLWALSPLHAISFISANGATGFFVLGAVFLVVTGTEALYADMGHFGRRPIRMAWLALVMPCLLLNYFGQGAALLADPSVAPEVFFALVPSALQFPVVGLATCATVIASQAVISGAFSLTRQAIRLGYLPRLRVIHTSKTEIGQIYVPAVNWMLMVVTVFLVLGFGSSSSLAAAYGVAVTTTMLVTSILFFVVATTHLGWHWLPTAGLVTLFVVVDSAFFGANISKLAHGAWFPLLIGLVGFVVMTTWKTGRLLIRDEMYGRNPTLLELAERIEFDGITRVPGQAVYLAGSPEKAPPALLHNLRHNHVVHESVAVVTVDFRDIPRVPVDEKVTVRELRPWLYHVEIGCGFMEDPHVPRLLMLASKDGFPFDPDKVSYFVGKEHVVPDRNPSMAPWRERIFAVLSRNALGATPYFNLPADRVVELGAQIEL